MDQNRLSCLNIVADLLSRCDTGKCVFPPTELYNEGWLLRIVLDWFSSHNIIEHELNFTPGCTWYSEALLPSPFLPRFRGDPLSESHTHADGLIGHIVMGSGGKAGTSLKPDARHLVVVEAKMFSRLSAGVKNALNYNQAARCVACVAELLRRANRKLPDIERLGMYIVAPDETIDAGWFEACMKRENISAVVERRVQEYGGERDRWFADWFLPVAEGIDLCCLGWEGILQLVEHYDNAFWPSLSDFYYKCLDFNGPGNQA